MLRVHSSLPEDLEHLVHKTIGCCIAVHRTLGPGLLEEIYARALGLELVAAGIPFQREKPYPVTYRGEVLCQQYLDLVVADQIVVELKSVEQLVPVNHAQLLSYMRVAHKRVGLLINFNVVVLKDGLTRKVL
jgi:GxxExxY protein